MDTFIVEKLPGTGQNRSLDGATGSKPTPYYPLYRKPVEEKLGAIMERRTLHWFVPTGERGSSFTGLSDQH